MSPGGAAEYLLEILLTASAHPVTGSIDSSWVPCGSNKLSPAMKPRHIIIAMAIIVCGASLLFIRMFGDGDKAPSTATDKERAATHSGRYTKAGGGDASSARLGKSRPSASPDAQTHVPRHPADTEPPERWRMNLNPEYRAQMTLPPPPWLKIGKPAPARLGGDPKNIEWKRFGSIDQARHKDIFLKSPRLPSSEPISKRVNGDATIKHYGPGMIVVPNPLGDRARGTSALVNDSRTMALVCSQVYDITGQSLALESGRPVPELNYDDARRSQILWETWMSDTKLVGLMSEETIDEQGPVRSALYTYDVTTKELQQVVLPDPVMDVYMKGFPEIQILATAPNALLIKVGGGYDNGGKDFVLLLAP
jgi:hypothetical protein